MRKNIKIKKIIGVLLLVILLVIWGVKIYDTYAKYRIPEDVHYVYGDALDYQGVRYRLNSAEIYDFDEILKVYGLEEHRTQLDLDEEELGQQKYVLVKFEITALEENYQIDTSRMYAYNEYDVSPVMIDYMYYMNNGSIIIDDLNIGEPREYLVVFGIWGCYYSEKTFNELDVDDIQINIDDSENGLVYCFEL